MNTVTRKLVPEDRRADHADEIFGLDFPLRLEPTVFTFADRLSPDYRGGYWQFYGLSNGGFYLSPDADISFEVVSENGYRGRMSAEAFGITVCLYAYSHLSFGHDEFARKCASQFHLLREYALDHAQVAAILAAID